MTPQAMKQLGKGIGRGSAPPAAQTNGQAGLKIQPNNMFQKAVQNAQKPIQAYQAEQKKGAAYIHGLTKTNEDEENFGPINPYLPGFCAPGPSFCQVLRSHKKTPRKIAQKQP